MRDVENQILAEVRRLDVEGAPLRLTTSEGPPTIASVANDVRLARKFGSAADERRLIAKAVRVIR